MVMVGAVESLLEKTGAAGGRRTGGVGAPTGALGLAARRRRRVAGSTAPHAACSNQSPPPPPAPTPAPPQRRQARAGGHPHHQLLHLLPHALACVDAGQPLQAPQRHPGGGRRSGGVGVPERWHALLVRALPARTSRPTPPPPKPQTPYPHHPARPQSYHLGGMGCGNGVVAVGLVRDLLQARGAGGGVWEGKNTPRQAQGAAWFARPRLTPPELPSRPPNPQARPGATALFVPAEITSYAFYPGSDRTYMVANAIFRMVGARGFGGFAGGFGVGEPHAPERRPARQIQRGGRCAGLLTASPAPPTPPTHPTGRRRSAVQQRVAAGRQVPAARVGARPYRRRLGLVPLHGVAARRPGQQRRVSGAATGAGAGDAGARGRWGCGAGVWRRRVLAGGATYPAQTQPHATPQLPHAAPPPPPAATWAATSCATRRRGCRWSSRPSRRA
jgi:hypothetical protein